ncbi:MAG: DUF2332 domain-containing protein [Alphaproteobacteria bacterium]|nr:DUF2332 domain-containing protein [Alphaproteobacteria bacterium]MBT4083701.1 DUF2332 domain-containing protein [Alphaproteobacteria bacterium]MBT4545223.1 DUF2332 domain-containing protein [Alphaproteobacteria bacterium]MBT5917183.1 DUF2332 domain-containing protein [Alphaproteobacteria bacterium]MBT7744611.1 DUF2332 domain-containing protein [Alphaproteobacteria bacterium]
MSENAIFFAMNNEKEVREAFASQAKWCDILGSPLTASLVDGLGRKLDRHTKTGQIVLDWQGPPDALGDSVPLRLAGALHALVRRGQATDLASVYPPNALPSAGILIDAALAAIQDFDDELVPWIQFAPQTNEVARSGALYPGMMQIAAQTGLPLAIHEVGASAGLNMNMDRYAYLLGGHSTGDPESAVTLTPNWHGPAPSGSRPVVRSRRGCDRNPIDVSDDTQFERLISFVWPDQDDRLARITSACEIAQRHPLEIDRMDAADWVDKVFTAQPTEGVVRVLYHSIAFQYFPDDTKRRIHECMNIAGDQATADTPVAWLAYELQESGRPALTLRLWPGHGEQVIAEGDAHCRDIKWMA